MKNFTLCGVSPFCRFAILKKFILTVVLFLGINAVYAAPVATVVVTPATNGLNMCSATAQSGSQPAFTTLNTITIAETSATDFETGATVLTFLAPAGYQYNAASTITIVPTGADIASITTTVSTSALVVTVNISAGLTVDNFTISGLQVRALNPAVAANSIRASKSPGGNFNGISPGLTSFADLSLVASPTVSASNGGAICDGGTLNLTSTATGTGTIHYAWSGPSSYSSTLQNPFISPAGISNSGTYSLTVTDDPTGCTEKATTVTTVSAAPGAISGNSGPLCEGGTLNLSVNPGSVGTWSSSDPAFATVNGSGVVSTSPAATHSVVGTPTINFISVCGTVSTIITVNPVPPAIAGPSHVCVGATAVYTNGLAGGTWVSAFPAIGSIDASGNFSALSAGTTNVQYIAPTGGCSKLTTVTVDALPAVSVLPVTSVCAGANLSFGVSPAGQSYLWNGPSLASATQQNPTVTNATVGASGIYTVKVTNAQNCSVTTTVSALVNANPAAIQGAGAVCVTSVISLSDADAGGTWTSSAGTVALSGTATQTLGITGVTGGGTTTISYKFTGTGCVATKTVSVNSLPVVPAPTTSAVCVGSTLTFNTAATNGTGTSGALSYAWSGPVALSASANPTFPSVNLGANGTFTITVTDTKSCSNSNTVITTVNALPTLTDVSLSAATLCVGDLLTLTANGATGSSSQLRYNWTGPAGFTASTASGINTQNRTLNATSASGNYSVTVTYFGVGCTSASVSTPALQVNLTPTVNVSGKSICSGTNVNLALGATILSSFTWAVGSNPLGVTIGNLSGAGSPISETLTNTVNTTPAVIEFIVTPTGDVSTGSCPGIPASLYVTVNPTPVMTITPTQTNCGSLSQLLGASTASNFVWSAGTGLLVSGAHSGTGALGTFLTDNLVNTDPGHAAVGVQLYSIIPTSTAGVCTNPVPFVLTVNVNPGASLTGPTSTSICSGTVLNFSVTPTVTSSITWVASATIGTVPDLPIGTFTVNPVGSVNPIIKPAGTFTLTNSSNSTPAVVTFTVTPSSSGGGCTGNPVSVTVTVYPTPSVTATFSSPICSDFSPNLVITPSTPSALAWQGGSPNGITNFGSGSTTTITDALHNPSASLQGTVVYSVIPTSTIGSCAPTTPILFTVSVNPLPTVAPVSPVAICSGTSPEIALASSIPSDFSYTFGNIQPVAGSITGAIGSSGTPISQNLTNQSNAVSGSVDYFVRATSHDGGCLGPVTTITQAVKPAVALAGTSLLTTICSGTSAGVALNASTGVGSTFTWTVPTNLLGALTNTVAATAISDVLTNTSNSTPASIVYNVKPTFSGCDGVAVPITVVVNPQAQMNPVSKSICSSFGSNVTFNSGTTADSTRYGWTVAANPFGASVNGSVSYNVNTFSEVLTDTSHATPATVVYSVTPSYTHNGVSCPGGPSTVTVVVNPTPVVNTAIPSGSKTVCSGTQQTNIPLSATTLDPADSFSWTTGNISPLTTSIFDSVNSGVAGGASLFPSIKQILINTSHSDPGTIDYRVIPVSTHGCVGSVAIITVTVNPAPNVLVIPTSVCSGQRPAINGTLAYSLQATTGAGGTFTWGTAFSSATVTGNSHAPFSGSPVITDTAINSNDSTLGTITYSVIATSALGCVGPVNQVPVTVNPLPAVAGYADAICSKFSPNIQLVPVTSVASNYSWAVTDNSLVTAATASGTTNVLNDVLTNTGFTSVGTIVFTVTPTSAAAGCTGFPSVFTVSVNPTPKLRSLDHEAICSESPFNYQATSSTDAEGGATQFAWYVQALNDNTVPQTISTDSTGAISENVSSKQIHTQSTVNFAYTLVSRGCISDTNVILTVNPRPEKPIITASAPSSICANTMFQNFGANIPVDSGHVFYRWFAGPDAVIYDTSTSGVNRNILVNFPTAGVDSVKVIAYVDTFVGCISSAVSIINVTSNIADDPARVVYHNHMFICLKNNVDTFGYLWGFDEAGTLVADTLKNEVNQSYYNANPDTLHRFYWVIANHSECPQKSYYNSPHSSIRNVVPPAEEVGVRIYPNPASTNINIEFGDISGAEYTADIYDVTGRKVSSMSIKDLVTSVSVKDFSTGCYIIECRKNGIKVAISRFIKN